MDKQQLQPIGESQRRVPNINRNSIEKSISELIGHIVSMWSTATGLPFEERCKLTVKICKMLIAVLCGASR